MMMMMIEDISLFAFAFEFARSKHLASALSSKHFEIERPEQSETHLSIIKLLLL